MNKQILITTIAALLVIATAVIVWAAGEAMPRSVIPGGGGTGLQNGDYILHGALGQPVAGSVENSEYRLCSGFWCGGPVTHTVYIPLVLKEWPDAPDTCPGYGPIQFLPAQYHDLFSHYDDLDWYSFTATAGRDYVIETSSLGPNTDTVAYLYAGNCSTLITFNDDISYPTNVASRINWHCSTSGTYHVKVTNWDKDTYGSGTRYTFTIEEK